LIYFISIIDVSEGGGVPKWDFIHPDTPKPLRERLEKYRELAASFVYGIITAFGGEIIGDRIRELRLSEIQTIFMRLRHGGAMYYVVFIVDIRDKPAAVYRIFMKFYRRYRDAFDEIFTEVAVPTSTIERLRNAMAQFLVPYARKSRTFGARDLRHMLSSYMVSVIITTILAIIVWGINKIYNLKATQPMTLVALAFTMLFMVPSIPIGFLTQYRRLAVVVAYLNSLSVVVGAALLWQDILRSGAASILGRPPESMVIIGAAALVGVMLGTVLAFLSILIAGFYEARKLTSIRPLKLIPEVAVEEERRESKEVGLPSMEEIAITDVGEENTHTQ